MKIIFSCVCFFVFVSCDSLFAESKSFSYSGHKVSFFGKDNDVTGELLVSYVSNNLRESSGFNVSKIANFNSKEFSVFILFLEFAAFKYLQGEYLYPEISFDILSDDTFDREKEYSLEFGDTFFCRESFALKSGGEILPLTPLNGREEFDWIKLNSLTFEVLWNGVNEFWKIEETMSPEKD